MCHARIDTRCAAPASHSAYNENTNNFPPRRLCMSHHYWLSALCLASLSFAVAAGGTSLKYPATKRGDQVDDYHGTKVADPYRWLEDDVRKSQGRRRLGRRREQGHLRLSQGHPRPRRDQETHHRSVELRKNLAAASLRAAATSSARTTACRTRPSITRRKRSTAQPDVLLDPNTVVQGRHRRPGGHGVQRGRQVPRLRRRRGRLRLEHLEGHARRIAQAARRRAALDQVQQHLLDARRQGLLL